MWYQLWEHIFLYLIMIIRKFDELGLPIKINNKKTASKRNKEPLMGFAQEEKKKIAAEKKLERITVAKAKKDAKIAASKSKAPRDAIKKAAKLSSPGTKIDTKDKEPIVPKPTPRPRFQIINDAHFTIENGIVVDAELEYADLEYETQKTDNRCIEQFLYDTQQAENRRIEHFVNLDDSQFIPGTTPGTKIDTKDKEPIVPKPTPILDKKKIEKKSKKSKKSKKLISFKKPLLIKNRKVVEKPIKD